MFVRSSGGSKALFIAPVSGGRANRVSLTALRAGDELFDGGRMDLSGQRLAYVLSSRGQPQVLMQQIDGKQLHRVARLSPGESGSAFVGLNFDGRTLGFARAFYGDWQGRGTAFRFRSGRLGYASVPRRITDFALGGASSFWINAPEKCFARDNSEDASCYFAESAGRLRFKPWDRGWGGPW